MIIVTTDTIPGQNITTTVGLVRGNTIRARHLGKYIFAVFKNIVGGEISEYTKLMFLLAWFTNGDVDANEKPAFTDYCQRLEQEIQGRKHGFLAGNVTYYVGGFHASWKLLEDETIGLTHPFHHDLRSRGVGLLTSELAGTEHTGTGNDYHGWEFYKDTRVLYGSVIVDGDTHEHPSPKSMIWRPDRLICEYEVGGVTLKEEKFIAANDAAASIITASQPVTLRFSGHSFFHRNSVSSSASIKFDQRNNAIVVSEGGTVRSRPDPDGDERIGPCAYTGMTTVLSASRDFVESIITEQDQKGVQHYSFSVPCDSAGTTVSWAMHDAPNVAIESARNVIRSHKPHLAAKTAEMNRQLNDEIPWFRCPDEKFVNIYYYLWSLYLMYYIDVDKGWERENHTQTAVNNFLGMHRYDAAFQIKVGAWTTDKPKYAFGNVLTWKHLTKNNRYRELPNGQRMIADNKGISWHSGAYGGETSEHVLGAWQIYEHTGDVGFLKECYENHFVKLFRKQLTVFSMNQFEVAETLEKMARLTGNEADVKHWQKLIRRDPEHIREMFEQRWEVNGIAKYFAAPNNGMIMTNGFWAMRSPYFPNEYAEAMVDAWAVDREKGFYGHFFPLAMARQSMKTFKTNVDHSFGYTPDTAYFTLDGMFRQRLVDDATELTLNHLANYNYNEQWQIPVAPEAYRRDLTLFGDQYSNFNAGKILLYLEGLAGLKYSVPDQQFTVRSALPKSWEWMEVRLPIAGQWTRIRYSEDDVQVSGCPLPVSLN
ncbi:MAG: heavy metal-binding domain-containing protein [Fuerstiella sp.]|nr:heavy metal-binding domain-containing protein [Fuerstiella sp.]